MSRLLFRDRRPLGYMYDIHQVDRVITAVLIPADKLIGEMTNEEFAVINANAFARLSAIFPMRKHTRHFFGKRRVQ